MNEQLAKAAPAALGWLAMLWISPAAALAGLAFGGGVFLWTRSMALSMCWYLVRRYADHQKAA